MSIVICVLLVGCARTVGREIDRDAAPSPERDAATHGDASQPPETGGRRGGMDASATGGAPGDMDAEPDFGEATIQDASLPSLTDVGPWPEQDAAADRQEFFGPLVDAGPAPPPYCVAPCVWEAFVRCQPRLQTCIEQDLAGVATTTCDLESGWSVTDGYMGYGNSSRTIDRYGERCYAVGARWDGTHYLGFFDYRGRVAFGAYSGSSALVFCGDVDPSQIQLDEPLPPGVEEYTLDLDAPECAAFDPMGPKLELHCETTTPGTCPR